MEPKVLADEVVYAFPGGTDIVEPFWNTGGTTLVDMGGGIIVLSGQIPIADPTQTYANLYPTIWRRDHNGWEQMRVETMFDTREPVPLARHGESIYAYENPLRVVDGKGGTTLPHLARYDSEDTGITPDYIPIPFIAEPQAPLFTLWSYRGIAVDHCQNTLFLTQHTENYYASLYTLMTPTAQSIRTGKIDYVKEYYITEPMRVAYHCTAIHNNFAVALGVTDIWEYNPDFLAVRGKWAFRRLMYTWSTNLRDSPLKPWVELDRVEQYGGQVQPLDIYLDDDHRVHILWYRESMDGGLQNAFWSDIPITYELKYGIIEKGVLIHTQTLLYYDNREGRFGEYPVKARFQITPENRIFVIFGAGGSVYSLHGYRFRLTEITGCTHTEPVTLWTSEYFIFNFQNTSVRSGSPKSRIANLALWQGGQVRYLRIRVC